MSDTATPPGAARRAAGAAAIVLLLVYWTWALGRAPLFDVDEGAFAEASREMRAGGDWGHTTLAGADRFDKPILVYWLQAAALAVCGVDEVAVRLPSALAALAWCVALAAFAAPRDGTRAAWLAAAMLATSLGPLLIGRAATADALLNALLALAMTDLWRAIEAGGADRGALRRCALWCALGMLTKGPVAVLIPAATLLLWQASVRVAAPSPLRHSAASARLPWRALADVPAWAIFAGVALPWYAYALHRHGRAFVEGFFVHHNLERFRSPLEGHGGSVFYYLALLPLLWLPWTPCLALLWRGRRKVWAEPRSRFLLAWSAFVLVFFSLSGTKLPHYALYGLSPLVLLAAARLAPAGLARCGRAIAVAVAAAAAGTVWLGLASPQAVQAWVASGRSPADAHWRALLDPAAAPVPPTAALGVAATLAIAGMALLAWRSVRWRLHAVVAAALVDALVWTTAVVPWWGEALQGPVRNLARLAEARGLALVQWQLDQPSASFYRGAAAPKRSPAPGEAALVRADRLAALPAAERAGLETLAAERGFVLVVREPPAANAAESR